MQLSFSIKIRETFVCLLVGCYKEVISAETTIGGVYFLINPTISDIFPWVRLDCSRLSACLFPCC